MFGRDGPSFWELAEQALSSTERGYDLLAPKFDATPFRTPPAILAACDAYLRRGVAPRQSVDLCCGTGVGLEMLRRLTTERVVGVDFSRNMLEEARHRLEAGSAAARDTSRPQLELIQEDVMRLAERRDLHGCFDCATCFGALGHIREEEADAFFRGIRRCLAPEGRLVLVTFDHPKPWQPAWLVSRAYNGATRVRNHLVRPEFHMYYLTYTWPKLGRYLRRAGFQVSTPPQAFVAPFQSARLVVAKRPTEPNQSAKASSSTD